MAEMVSLEVIVEGIEPPMQADLLDGVGRRTLAQGGLLRRPVSANESLLRLIDEEKKYFEVAD
jgi:EAL domain-containing protein (putative c-di-GMP-specific phosphodiesterase class I)